VSNQATATTPGEPRPATTEPVARWRRVAGETLLGGKWALLIPITVAVLLLVVSGVNLSFGYAGEIQFGQVFMFALGTYVTMILAGTHWDEIIPLIIIGGLAAAIVGAVIAFPAVRIGGWSLA